MLDTVLFLFSFLNTTLFYFKNKIFYLKYYFLTVAAKQGREAWSTKSELIRGDYINKNMLIKIR